MLANRPQQYADESSLPAGTDDHDIGSSGSINTFAAFPPRTSR
jgi:hypothetical protein